MSRYAYMAELRPCQITEKADWNGILSTAQSLQFGDQHGSVLHQALLYHEEFHMQKDEWSIQTEEKSVKIITGAIWHTTPACIEGWVHGDENAQYSIAGWWVYTFLNWICCPSNSSKTLVARSIRTGLQHASDDTWWHISNMTEFYHTVREHQLSWVRQFSSGPTGKCQNNSLHQTMTLSFHILSN